MIYDDEEKLFNARGKEEGRARDISPLRIPRKSQRAQRRELIYC